MILAIAILGLGMAWVFFVAWFMPWFVEREMEMIRPKPCGDDDVYAKRNDDARGT